MRPQPVKKVSPPLGYMFRNTMCFPNQWRQDSRQHFVLPRSDATGRRRWTRRTRQNEVIYLVYCYHLENTSCPPSPPHCTQPNPWLLARTRSTHHRCLVDVRVGGIGKSLLSSQSSACHAYFIAGWHRPACGLLSSCNSAKSTLMS